MKPAILMVVPEDADQLGPWAGYLAFTLWWVVVVLTAGAALMVRRHAP